MRTLLIAALLASACASTPPVPANQDFQLEVLQGAGEAPPTYLYTILIANTSSEVMTVNAITVEPFGAGDVAFKNGNLTPQTTLEPGEQGEFRMWAEAFSSTGFHDREGPATLRVHISYTIGGKTQGTSNVYKVQRPR